MTKTLRPILEHRQMDQTLSAQHPFQFSHDDVDGSLGSRGADFWRQFALGFVGTVTAVVSLGGLPLV
jgi:hypothetical protein